jgi:hypothetical protein
MPLAPRTSSPLGNSQCSAGSTDRDRDDAMPDVPTRLDTATTTLNWVHSAFYNHWLRTNRCLPDRYRSPGRDRACLGQNCLSSISHTERDPKTATGSTKASTDCTKYSTGEQLAYVHCSSTQGHYPNPPSLSDKICPDASQTRNYRRTRQRVDRTNE